jgi:hypothetical protein
MKYSRPLFQALFISPSGWCNVGSSGEAADNNCTTGSIPATTNCSTGAANSSGHCKTGSTVTNSGPTAVSYCQTGTGGQSGTLDCAAGNKAFGATGCKTGTAACHCTTGSGA